MDHENLFYRLGYFKGVGKKKPFACQINLNNLCGSDNIIFWVSDD